MLVVFKSVRAQNYCRIATRAVLTAIIFGLCAFACLFALWFIPSWIHTTFPSLWFLGSFPIYGIPWRQILDPISTVSIIYGLVIGMLYLTGWHKRVSHFKSCLCVVLLTAVISAPAFGMYWHYTDIMAGFVPLNATEKIFSGLFSPLAAAGLLFYGLDYLVLCTFTGGLGTLWLGNYCRKTLWAERPQGAKSPALPAFRAACLGILLYAGGLCALFLVLNGAIASRGAYAQAFEAVFAKGSPEEITRFLETHSPDLLEPLKPAYRYKSDQRSALVFASNNPNPDAFSVVAQHAPITDNNSIEQYLEAFSRALDDKSIPVLQQIAHIYSNKQYEYRLPKNVIYSEADAKTQHILLSITELLQKQQKHSPDDIRAILQACSDIGVFTKITRMDIDRYNAHIVEWLRDEGWLNDAAMDDLLDAHVRSLKCNSTVTQMLLRLGATPRSGIMPRPERFAVDHCPQLAAALIACSEDIITQLIAAGADPHAPCDDGRSIAQFLNDLMKKGGRQGKKLPWLEERRALFDRILGGQPPQEH